MPSEVVSNQTREKRHTEWYSSSKGPPQFTVGAYNAYRICRSNTLPKNTPSKQRSRSTEQSNKRPIGGSFEQERKKNGLLNIDVVSFSVSQSRLVTWRRYAVTKSQISCGRDVCRKMRPRDSGRRHKAPISGRTVASSSGCLSEE